MHVFVGLTVYQTKIFEIADRIFDPFLISLWQVVSEEELYSSV